MNGVTINGNHSLDDFGLYLQPKSIPVPQPKTNIVSIQGADGKIDLSTALTDGNMLYDNRVIKLSFAAIGYGTALDSMIEEFTNAVHGKTVELVFDDDADHYFVGRGEITDRDYRNGYAILECEFDCEPYRYEAEVTTITEAISGTRAINVANSRQWVVPTITASAAMAVQYQGVLYQVPQGRHVNENLVLRDGVNVLTFQGTGTIVIEYRQGVL